jgi:EmrB/QacA subfamily drug resistance transporter
MFLAASLSPLGSTMIAVALPSIGSELGVPSGLLTQWLVSSYLITGIAVMSPGGKLGDRIGHARCLTLGMIIYGVGSAAGFVFGNLPSLAAARVAMAAGGALTVPATMALLRNVTPEARRPRTFGYFGSVMGTAAAIGPLVGGELTARFGWRSIFVANIPVILTAMALIRTVVPAVTKPSEAPNGKSMRFDIEGSILLGIGLMLLVIATQVQGTAAFWSAIAGVFLLAIFIAWERNVQEPVLDLRLYTRRTFAAANAVIGLQNLAMYAMLFQLPIFFEQVRSAPPGQTGRTVIAMMIAMVVAAPLGGRLAEHLGVRRTVLAGCTLSLAGLYSAGRFAEIQTFDDILMGLILMGIGIGLSSAPAQAASMSAVSRAEAGMAGGAVSTARYIGGVIGISALGYLLGSGLGVSSHTRAVSVYGLALGVATVSALLLPGRVAHATGSVPTTTVKID